MNNRNSNCSIPSTDPATVTEVENNSGDINIAHKLNITTYDDYLSIFDYNKLTSNKSDISIFSLNINSLRKNCDEFVGFLMSLNSLPDIIILSETRCDIDEIIKLNFANFNYTSVYPVNNKCGGVTILIQKKIIFSIENKYAIKNDSIENCVIKIKSKNRDIYISGIYKHPGLSISHFMKYIKQHIINIPKTADLIISGDVNIDLTKLDDDVIIKNYADKIKSLNCTQLVNLPTRITSTTSTLIDHTYYRSNRFTDIRTGVFINKISDHQCTFIKVNANANLNAQKTEAARIINQRNIDTFKNLIQREMVAFNIDDPTKTTDIKWCEFTSIMTKNFNSAFPLKEISINRLKNKAWVTRSIMKSIKRKEMLFKTWQRNRTIENQIRYKNYKNRLTACIKKAKELYFMNLFDSDKSNKNMWQLVNYLYKDKKISNDIPDLINDSNESVIGDKNKADHFNKYFSTIGEEMNKSIINTNNLTFENYMPNKVVNCSIRLQTTNEIEIMKYINNLPNKASCGTDQISQKLLKVICQEVTPTLTKLINLSIKETSYPKCLKSAKIIPIYKNGDRSSCNNYRPISLLSAFNKIFELKLHNDLSDFIENNNIYYSNQFGFRKFHSTVDALIKVHDHIIQQKRLKMKIFGIFIDLKKAFDSIDNEILIKKLPYYGIRGPFIKLINSYLTDRICQTIVNNSISQSNQIKYGVPQGSILGPLLFALYINDLESLSNDVEINLFADDTAIFCSESTYTNLIKKSNETLKTLDGWLRANKLTLNTQKTHFVDFSKDKNKSHIPKILKYDSRQLEEKEYTKYLGMIIQNNLEWNIHIKNLINRLNRFIPLYYQLKSMMSMKRKLIIFNALTSSLIRYGIELYAQRDSKWIKQLQKTQNRLLKVLFNLPHLTRTNTLHKEKGILKITDHMRLRTLLISQKVVHKKNETNSSHKSFTRNEPSRNLRSILNFQLSAEFYNKFNKISENAAILWNSLSNETKRIKKRNDFKEAITKQILDTYV